MKIALVLGLLTLTLIVFPLEIVSVDIVALSGLLILVAVGILTPDQAFAAFGSEIIVLLGSIFVIAGALLRTGVLDSVGVWLYRHCGSNYRVLLGAIILVVASMSAFMNNTVVTAVFVPVVLAVARRAGLPPSKLLMPTAFASMLGGCCTLIGTSTNLAAGGFLVQRGMQPFALFEFLPAGLILVAAGLAFFLLAGNRILPERGVGELTGEYHVREFTTEIGLRAGCPLVGQRIAGLADRTAVDFTIMAIVRSGVATAGPDPQEVLRADDVLVIKGAPDALQRIRQLPGIESKGELELKDALIQSASVRLVEVMVGPASRFLGRTLKEIDFRRRFGLIALAIHRHGEELVDKVGRIPLAVGDLLLVQGAESHLHDLRRTGNVIVLGDLSHFLLERRKGTHVVLLFVAAIALGGFKVLPLGAAVLAAAILSVLVLRMSVEESYRLIDWRLLMLIGGMTGFGRAMVATGADRFLADLILEFAGGFGVYGILAGFYILTVALSQPLSNAAAALAVLPIAIATAESLGVSTRTFAVMVTLSASVSFITPLEPSCVLVYPAGRYRFRDFVTVGGALTAVVMVVLMVVVPIFWPLN